MTKPNGFSSAQGFVAETVLTFILVFTILGTAEEKAVVGKNSALAVGGVVALCGLTFSPISGASMNPARSIGPMIASAEFNLWWIYTLAPLLGAAIAVGACFGVYGAVTSDAKHTAHGSS
ncbi:MAG: hypothetical protein NVSMB64_11670 [Candidatus Velthaea sp.]